MRTPRELQTLYEQGTNISALLREEQGLQGNTSQIIEIACELQTGSYTAAMRNAQAQAHKSEYTREIAGTIRALCQPESILEAGVGEATTLAGVLRHLGGDIDSFGFDLSWSRVAYANRWLHSQGVTGTTLCTGDLCHIPFADNSIDVVYTSHSVEPNGGREEPILRELYRVSRKALILLEPGFELAGAQARLRMESHGYCKDLNGMAKRLGFNVVSHELFPYTANPLNPTAITIITKDSACARPAHILACPKFKTPLEPISGMLFSPEALVVYPVAAGIPCLRIENGILASKYKEFVQAL